jgi:hypothetical protein
MGISLMRGKRELLAAELLRAASDARAAGRREEAIVLLRDFGQAASREQGASIFETYDWETFLELPMSLHEAGRREEAWRELDRLKTQAAALLPAPRACAAMSDIQDTERLLLQRDGLPVQAVALGLESMLSWAKSLYLQRRLPELAEYCAVGNVRGRVLPLLLRARLDSMLGPVTQIALKALAEIPNERAGVLRAELARVPGWPAHAARPDFPAGDRDPGGGAPAGLPTLRDVAM